MDNPELSILKEYLKEPVERRGSQRDLAKRLNWSESKTSRRLRRLELEEKRPKTVANPTQESVEAPEPEAPKSTEGQTAPTREVVPPKETSSVRYQMRMVDIVDEVDVRSMIRIRIGKDSPKELEDAIYSNIHRIAASNPHKTMRQVIDGIFNEAEITALNICTTVWQQAEERGFDSSSEYIVHALDYYERAWKQGKNPERVLATARAFSRMIRFVHSLPIERKLELPDELLALLTFPEEPSTEKALEKFQSTLLRR